MSLCRALRPQITSCNCEMILQVCKYIYIYIYIYVYIYIYLYSTKKIHRLQQAPVQSSRWRQIATLIIQSSVRHRFRTSDRNHILFSKQTPIFDLSKQKNGNYFYNLRSSRISQKDRIRSLASKIGSKIKRKTSRGEKCPSMATLSLSSYSHHFSQLF